MNRSTTVGSLIAGTAIALSIFAGSAPAAADSPPATITVGCAGTVQLQALQFPMSAGPRRSASALLPDDGGALPPTLAVVENRTADTDELDLVVGTGENASVRTLYVAPAECAIAWSHQVQPFADPTGRRSLHVPAFTLRLIALSRPACPECPRPV